MNRKSNIKRLMSYAGKRKYLSYSSWVLSAASALLALVPFVYIWRIIRDVLSGSMESLTQYGQSAVIFAAAAMLVYIAALMCSHIAAFRIAANMRRECMAHIVKLPLGAAEGIGSGKLRKTVMSSTAATESFLAHRLPDKAGAIATPVGLLAMLMFFDWRLGLLSLVPVVLGFVIMSFMTGKRMEKKMKEYQNSLADMSNEAVEYVRGIPVVKTFGQTVYSFKRFKAAIDNYEKWVIAYTKDLRMPMMCYTTAINAVFAFLISGGIALTADGVSTELLLNLLFYIIITPVIATTLTKLMFMSEDNMLVNDAISRIDSVLGIEPLEERASVSRTDGNAIRLEEVSYSYDGLKDAVHKLTLEIPEGQSIALVGKSGSGKSTLASLISRFFDPTGGRVLIGGVDIRELGKEELMNKVSFVFQNSRLVKASIRENVRMARPNATDAEVMAALKTAQCTDIIEKLPKGIDTVIGTRGVYLSGGEQQRIAIARAILKDAPILILDEATAFADPDNEALVQSAFAEMAKQKTVIMIAHRLTTVQNADCIYVLDNGVIEEKGTHRELLERGGLYKRMWDEYQSSANWRVGK